MVGRPKIIRTPEENKELEKKRRTKYKKYFAKYAKYNYLKKILENPNYNRENYLRRKKSQVE
jgi:hypothetical protein